MRKQWFVATTKHRQEVRAAGELRDQKYRVYLPKLHEQSVVGRRVEIITSLRFPGYIFIEFDLEKQEHGPINNTRAVGDLITRLAFVDGEEKVLPAPLPDDWELEMRLHEEMGWEVATGRTKPDPRADLHHGDIVQIDRKGHAAHGQQGEYSRTENGQAIVWVGFSKVKLPEADLFLIRSKNKSADAA